MSKKIIQIAFETSNLGETKVAELKTLIERAMPPGVTLNFTTADEYEEFPAQTQATKTTWLLVEEQEDTPYFIVDHCGDLAEHGKPVTEAEMEALLRNNLCEELFVRYPRAERYGIPDIANSKGAKSFVSEHFPRISTSFEVNCEDSGDDSGSCVWLRLEAPL